MSQPAVEVARAHLEHENLDAFIVPSEDPHNSEYPAAFFLRRGWISGFHGSAGTAVLLRTGKPALFVDPRYWLAAAALPNTWEVLKLGDLDAMTVERYLAAKLAPKARVGVDPSQYSIDAMEQLRAAMKAASLELVQTDNVVDRAWGTDRPPFPTQGCWEHPEKYAGRSAALKLADLRAEMAAKQCYAVLVSALDEVMWMLNLRGADALESPVLYSYLLVTATQATFYAWNATRVSSEVRTKLNVAGVETQDYELITHDLRDLGSRVPAGEKVWLDRKTANCALWNCVSGAAELELSPLPIAMWKAKKNKAEQDGMRDCHVLDAVAKTRFLAWIEDEVTNKGHTATITESAAAERLLHFRQQEVGFVSYSFETIMGYEANGADIHYHPNPDKPTVIGRGMLLIDSGGHYLNGTTDATRTIHLGTPTDHQRRCYTRVLQGHVDLARAVFPRKVKASQLDVLARLPLYQDGLDYLHGTGHGVGAFLNVHEYPPLISGGGTGDSNVVLQEGMIFSDEPGYYETGAFGIRIESLLLCNAVKTLHNFHHPAYLGLENLTIIPLCRKLIDVTLLSPEQIHYIDGFHALCRAKLEPLLRSHGDECALRFLLRETAPLEAAMVEPVTHRAWWKGAGTAAATAVAAMAVAAAAMAVISRYRSGE